jgi:hypothetical protein
MNVARGKFDQNRKPAATFVFLFATPVLWLVLPLSAQAPQTASLPAPSVVEVARQKSTDKKAKRVYTEDDFPPHVEPVDPKPKSEDAAEEAKPKADATAATASPADSANDSAEVKQARKVVETRQIQIDTLQEEKTALESRLHEGNRSADESAAISESIRSVEGKIGALKKEHDDAQKVIDASSKPKPHEQN